MSTMSKRAVLQITPYTNANGAEADLFLTFQELQVTEGSRWEWNFSQQHGRDKNDLGLFFKDFSDLTAVQCCDKQGDRLLMEVRGIVLRTFAEFPFKLEDKQSNLSGKLIVNERNT